MEVNNRKTYHSESSSKFIMFLGAAVLCYIFYIAGKTLINNIKLKLYGENQKAVVTKIINYKDTNPAINYEFEVDGIKYIKKGMTVSKEKAVGDSISILYLPNNPEVNVIIEN